MVRRSSPRPSARQVFLRHFPHAFIISAHGGGIALSAWLGRWDLVLAGSAFGAASVLLFLDLFSGRNITVKLLRRLIGP